MKDYFGTLHSMGVNTGLAEGDRFKISRKTPSPSLIEFTVDPPSSLLVKIFARNRLGHAYFGYIGVSELASQLRMAKENSSEKATEVEIPAYPSERCRIAALFIGEILSDEIDKYIMLTIVTDENSSFEIAVHYQDLCAHLKSWM